MASGVALAVAENFARTPQRTSALGILQCAGQRLAIIPAGIRSIIRAMVNAKPSPFMERAIQLAVDNVRSGRGGPFGAVVVQAGKILSEGVNRVTLLNDPTAHAEMIAIREACSKLGLFELRDCELYTSCEPCPMCLGAIYWARPARVFFGCTAADAAAAGFDDSFIYKEVMQPHAERKIPMVQLMREAALETFRTWGQQPNKLPY
jgi:guanine deaminase